MLLLLLLLETLEFVQVAAETATAAGAVTILSVFVCGGVIMAAGFALFTMMMHVNLNVVILNRTIASVAAAAAATAVLALKMLE